jgi:hypothetical protein
VTDTTPKSRLEGKRGHVIRTSPWAVIIQHYQKLIAGGIPFQPMLRLIESIVQSPVASQLFAGTSMFELLLSDTENFRSGDSTLCISYKPSERQFAFWHRSFSGHDDQKICTEAEALQTLRLFLRLKYGIVFEIPSA